MREKCSVTFPNSFVIVLALCSNSLCHDDDDMDELWLLPNIALQKVMLIVDQFQLYNLYGSCKATCSIVDATICLP
ncbi:hypothetical protein BHM03_00058652 [Ensete ventricosum]|nr:hypothetical protein BHM03_00058652 [Ensete ventricosum]